MPFWCYMHMLLFGKKEATWPPEGPQSNMVIKSLGCWRQYICLPTFQSPIVKNTKKGEWKWHKGTKQLIRQQRAALQNNDLIGVATLVHRLIWQKFFHILKVRLLKLRVRTFKKMIWGGSKRRDSFFLPRNLQWKLVNSSHATINLGEKALQRLLERSFRGIGLQMTIRQMVSSCPTCQLNNPQEAWRPQLAHPVQQHGTYPGEDWQMDSTQMPVSQGY